MEFKIGAEDQISTPLPEVKNNTNNQGIPCHAKSCSISNGVLVSKLRIRPNPQK